MANEPQATRLLGYLWLQPGLSKNNGMTMLFVCLTGIPFLVVINFIQPYILSAMLNLPSDQYGSTSGNLAVLHEIIMILLTGPAGALADKIGRRRVLTLGYLITAAGLAAYPWATSVTGLILLRCIYAVGAAGIVSSFSVLMADYPQEKSRGKFIAMVGVLNGLGIIILTGIGGNLPNWLVEAGYGQIPAGRLAMALIAIVCLVSALVIWRGLRGGDLGVGNEQKEPILSLLKKGLGAARNPRIAVSYASAFAARGDVVVIGTYVSLWGTQAGIAQGITEQEALKQATLVFIVVQTAALLASPFIGIMNDRINRVSALVVGMGLAALGYILFGLQSNPLGFNAMFIAFILGVGQISAILAGTTLVGQEADPKITGATLGVWSFFGAVGTLVGSWVGGQLFDFWRPGAPFLLVGAFNLIVTVWAIYVRIKYPQAAPLRVLKTSEAAAGSAAPD